MASWLDPQLNEWWLSRESPNDAAAAAGFRTGVAIAKDRRDQERDRQAMELKMLDMAADNRRTDLAVEQWRSKQTTELMKQQGLAELSSFVSSATAADKLSDPKTQADFWKLTGRWAPFMPDGMVNAIWDNTFKAAQDRTDRAMTGNIRDLEQARMWMSQANDAERAGDAALAAQLRSDALALQQSVAPKGFQVETYTDENGHQQIRMVQGGRVADATAPTIGTKTDVQKQALAAENAVRGGAELLANLGPESVGFRGAFNDLVINRGLVQLFPEMEQEGVATGRSLMTAFSERMIKSIKADSQLNQHERAKLEAALPKMGVDESFPNARRKIITFMEEARNVSRSNAERLKLPIPDWTLTKSEIARKYQAGEITKEKAEELIQKYHYPEGQ